MAFSASMPEAASWTLSWMYCEKAKVTPGKALRRALPMSAIRSSFESPLRQVSNGLSGTKNSTLEKPSGSVPSSGRPCWVITVSTSGKLLTTPAHAVGVGVALVERYRGRQRGAQPDIALLELGQEFQPDRAGCQPSRRHEGEARRDREPAPRQHDGDHASIEPAQAAHDDGLGLRHLLRQEQRSQRRRDGEGGQKAARQGVGVGLGHRAEDVAFDARQREQAAGSPR